jgi:hypothetical protein
VASTDIVVFEALAVRSADELRSASWPRVLLIVLPTAQ